MKAYTIWNKESLIPEQEMECHIDKRKQSIKTANVRKGNLSLDGYTTEEFVRQPHQIYDEVVSNSVLFFIEDFGGHTQQVFNYLNHSVAYYFAFCSFTRLSNFCHFKEQKNQRTHKQFILYTLDYIIKVFNENSFEVQLKKLDSNNCTSFNSKDNWYKTSTKKKLFISTNTYLEQQNKINI